MIETTTSWRSAYPGSSIGVLVMQGVTNPQQHLQLDEKKKDLEETLRAKFSSYDRATLKAIPVLDSYTAYYKQFNKTYHVQHQLESLVFKNKRIPKVAALVEAMFMAELKNLLLTAGHDLNAMELPLRIDVANGTESYIRMNGEKQMMKPGDMMIADLNGIVSCIIYGPDSRTRIRPETSRVVFTVYAPPGIEKSDVYHHLEDIQKYVEVIAPEASVEIVEIVGTD